MVIDQAVLLVSDLSAEKSVPYVNAVLDRIAGLADHIRAAERAVAVGDSSSQPQDSSESSVPSEASGAPADVSKTTSDAPGTATED